MVRCVFGRVVKTYGEGEVADVVCILHEVLAALPRRWLTVYSSANNKPAGLHVVTGVSDRSNRFVTFRFRIHQICFV